METKKLKDLAIGDSIKLGKYTATLVKKTGFDTGIFVMDQLLDKCYPRVGFKDRNDFMNIVKTEPDFEKILRKVTNARLLYQDEIFPNEQNLAKQIPYFRNTNVRVVNHRSINAWPDKNLLMDFDARGAYCRFIDPQNGEVKQMSKYQPAGVRLVLEVQMI